VRQRASPHPRTARSADRARRRRERADVAMIQQAHVGVGICGKEGLQAARASDFQIGFFGALKRLVCAGCTAVVLG
jgi:hypothetical protein